MLPPLSSIFLNRRCKISLEESFPECMPGHPLVTWEKNEVVKSWKTHGAPLFNQPPIGGGHSTIHIWEIHKQRMYPQRRPPSTSLCETLLLMCYQAALSRYSHRDVKYDLLWGGVIWFHLRVGSMKYMPLKVRSEHPGVSIRKYECCWVFEWICPIH